MASSRKPNPDDLQAARALVRKWKKESGASLPFHEQDSLERTIMEEIGRLKDRIDELTSLVLQATHKAGR